jgi:hypothetical protein
MTLRDKIVEATDLFYKSKLDSLEKIANEYAIEFAEWVTDSRNENVKGSISIEQLLEIFKKETKL